MSGSLDTSQIRSWQSIITLVVFVLTNIIVLFPFRIPVYVPRSFRNAVLDALGALRIISPRPERFKADDETGKNVRMSAFVRLNFPMNFVSAPLIADLFLLAISAIGRQEVYDGTIGADNISPIDIMVFFLSLAYIAISIDTSGLIKWLAFKVLQKGGKAGHRLFLFLYMFFFSLGSFIGNDPIILSGTPFLAYMTRVSSNIHHPRAWIYTQFSVANIASAILVSSNPTNLVLAGAFQIKFIVYTANMIVPVASTAVVMFFVLLYVIFNDDSLIPSAIEMHELSEESRAKKPVNPNIPFAQGILEKPGQDGVADDRANQILLEEIMNPFLDRASAAFGVVVMAATLITVLALNAASQGGGPPVYWVTLPAAFVMFSWDVAAGWYNRHETREMARRGRLEAERVGADGRTSGSDLDEAGLVPPRQAVLSVSSALSSRSPSPAVESQTPNDARSAEKPVNDDEARDDTVSEAKDCPTPSSLHDMPSNGMDSSGIVTSSTSTVLLQVPSDKEESPSALDTTDEKQEAVVTAPGVLPTPDLDTDGKKHSVSNDVSPASVASQRPESRTLVSITKDVCWWLRQTFPTMTTVLTLLPCPLVPFSLAMFVLVQALVTKGWVPVFAYGWDHWVNKTGTVGSIGGMGFLAVILCNFAGTNIGTAILLSRVIQAWQEIHRVNGIPISNRTFWATVYGMALGLNYGAFSTTFSASLAGLLWRDILGRKHIHVPGLEFARINLPIIAIAMTVGCVVLIGEVYVVRGNSPYDA